MCWHATNALMLPAVMLCFPPFFLQILMLLAWRELTTTSERRDVLSYWRLAGIHGMSWPYNGIQAPSE